MHLWVAWLQIAIRNAAEARHAREHGVAPSSVEAPSSAALSREFQCSMTAIAAVAFALEALPKEIEDAGHELDRSRFTKPTATNAGFYIAHRIVQAFSLAGSIATTAPPRLQQLFALRNDSVHFDSRDRQGTHPHPSGTRTAYEMTLYTAESSAQAVRVALEMLRECAASAAAGAFQPSATRVANEIPAVVSMLEEELKAAMMVGIAAAH